MEPPLDPPLEGVTVGVYQYVMANGDVGVVADPPDDQRLPNANTVVE